MGGERVRRRQIDRQTDSQKETQTKETYRERQIATETETYRQTKKGVTNSSR